MVQKYFWDGTTDSGLIEELSERFQAGQVGVVPTETVYGLMCLGSDRDAVDRLYEMKGRDSGQKCQVLVASQQQLRAEPLVDVDAVSRLAEVFWPGPLTLVCDVPGDTVGLRWPAHALVEQLIRATGPLLATSANPTGRDPADSVACEFADLAGLDFCVMGQMCGAGQASTVARLHDSRLSILRPGPVSLAQLEAVLGEVNGEA